MQSIQLFITTYGCPKNEWSTANLNLVSKLFMKIMHLTVLLYVPMYDYVSLSEWLYLANVPCIFLL